MVGEELNLIVEDGNEHDKYAVGVLYRYTHKYMHVD